MLEMTLIYEGIKIKLLAATALSLSLFASITITRSGSSLPAKDQPTTSQAPYVSTLFSTRKIRHARLAPASRLNPALAQHGIPTRWVKS